MDVPIGLFLFVVLMVIAALLLFLPTIIASRRRHANRLAITMLNVVMLVALVISLGLTAPFVAAGWIGALIWACTNNIEPQPN